MRRGIRIAIDVGSVRIGVARSDPDATLALPVQTVARGKGDLDAIAALVAEYEPLEVLVGLPVALSGAEGKAAAIARDFALSLSDRIAPMPVLLVDERLSTVQAQRDLQSAGKTTRQGRSVVDQAAAVVILEQALEAERRTGEPYGMAVRNS